jgi:hypothetical protein
LSGLAKLTTISAGDNCLGPAALTGAVGGGGPPASRGLPTHGKLAKLSFPRNALGDAGFVACCSVGTLQELDLSANGLTAVPDALSRLKLLVELVCAPPELATPPTLIGG